MSGKMIKMFLQWGGLLALCLAILELLKMVARKIDYSFSAISDLLLIIVLIGIILLGTKQYRDSLKNKTITYAKAFGFGALITVTAFFLYFGYMFLHFKSIEPDGIDRINKQNEQLYIKKAQKDTLNSRELEHFLTTAAQSLQCQTDTFVQQNASADSACLCNTIDTINSYLTIRILGPKVKSDTALYAIKNFTRFARKTLWDITEQQVKTLPDSTCVLGIQQIVAETQKELENYSPLKQRLEERSSKVPHYKSIFTIAFISSTLVFCYGIFVNIFTALYIYRKKEPDSPENT
jgi:hypothetical protein